MSLADVKTIADIAQGAVTTAAVVIGGVWAYFKFVKGRTFRPHVEIGVDALWTGPRVGSPGLRISVSLKNIGAAQVEPLQTGTGVMVRLLAEDQPPAPEEARWDDAGAFSIFSHHAWIEPGEVITDDLLLWLEATPHVVEVQVRVVLAWKPENVTVHARRVFLREENEDDGDDDTRRSGNGQVTAVGGQGRVPAVGGGEEEAGAGEGAAPSRGRAEGGAGPDGGALTSRR